MIYVDVVTEAVSEVKTLVEKYTRGAIIVILFSFLLGVLGTLLVCFAPPKRVSVKKKTQ